MANFEALRDIVHQTPNEALWARMSAALRDWLDEDPLDVAILYCQEHMARWPKDLPTFAPAGWFGRSAATVKNDPLTPFFLFAAQERTDHFEQTSRALVASARAGKPPSFLDLEAMGKMRWRSGEALSDKEVKQLIVVMKTRAAKEVGDAQLHRLRHYLNDSDCLRWSKHIRKSWEAAGSKSPHRWALFQVASFGTVKDVPSSPKAIGQLCTSNKAARARQYVQLVANADTREATEMMAALALGLPLHYSTRAVALDRLREGARRFGLGMKDYLHRQAGIFAPRVKAERKLVDALEGKAALSKAQRSALAKGLESDMVVQRRWLFKDLKEGIFGSRALVDAMASVVWGTLEGLFFRWTPDGAVGADSKSVVISDESEVTLAHPAQMSAKALGAWKEHLKAAGVGEALFLQLERPFWTTKAPLLAERVPIADAHHFFWESGWDVGSEEGAGFANSLRKIPQDLWWHVQVDVNFSIHVGEYDIEFFGEESAITGMSLHDKFRGGIDWKRDPVAFSEACALVKPLVDLAAVVPDEG